MKIKRSRASYVSSSFLLIETLHNGRYKYDELAKILGVEFRTVYRQMANLEEIGYHIEQDFKGRFFIASDVCPFCKKSTNHINER